MQRVLSYQDIQICTDSGYVIVDPVTGQVSEVASGFNNPLDVLAGEKGLFVADYSGGIYYISSATPVPEPSSTAGILAVGAFGAGLTLKRKLNG